VFRAYGVVDPLSCPSIVESCRRGRSCGVPPDLFTGGVGRAPPGGTRSTHGLQLASWITAPATGGLPTEPGQVRAARKRTTRSHGTDCPNVWSEISPLVRRSWGWFAIHGQSREGASVCTTHGRRPDSGLSTAFTRFRTRRRHGTWHLCWDELPKQQRAGRTVSALLARL